MKSIILSAVTSFFVGAATGVTLALLNTPRSGKETRTKIQKGIADVRSRTMNVFTRAQAGTMDRLDDTSRIASKKSAMRP